MNIKILRTVTYITLAVGVVICLAGLLLGGHMQAVGAFPWRSLPITQGEPETAAEQTGTGRDNALSSALNDTGITKAELDIGAAEVIITAGSEFKVTGSGGEDRYSVKHSGSTWKFETSEIIGGISFGGGSRKYEITMPSSLQELKIDLGAGKVTVSGITCETADISVGAGQLVAENFTCTDGGDFEVSMGEIKMDGTLTGKVDIDCGMGNVDFTVTRPADFGYIVDCSMGNVNIDGAATGSGLANEMSENTKADTVYDIDCGMGNIKISFN